MKRLGATLADFSTVAGKSSIFFNNVVSSRHNCKHSAACSIVWDCNMNCYFMNTPQYT